MASTIALISDAIPSMTQLRSLSLRDYNTDSLDQDIIPTLRSKSISHLILSNFKIRVDMPELQSLVGNFSTLTTLDECTQPTTLAKLKELIVLPYDMYMPENISVAAIKSIFRRLTNIEKLKWRNTVNYEIFNAICDICTPLKELVIDYDLLYFNASNLNKLTHLRRLRPSCSSNALAESYSNKFIIDLSKLTLMEHIELPWDEGHTFKLPTSLKSLEVCIGNNNRENSIQTIINCGAHLKELKVVIQDYNPDDSDYEEPIELLKALSSLKHLEILDFNGGLFQESSFLRMNAPLVRLHKLRFDMAKLQSSKPVRKIGGMSNAMLTFRGLKEKFPNLKKPEFSCCRLITGRRRSGSE
ncbi:uncharacterized protein LOC125956447 isoform X1 [Anopheles darlingi]|uniref:uncharacterized protein LOC125956447 isoform X1 n=1 Tax=Anopheles darlingi TaxID=43151 RepID=UPI002100293F|nr:uncharacterized protein LOC125956447 isoform X1 [Anopheles darlingi]